MCQNGGICHSNSGKCSCANGYQGSNCENKILNSTIFKNSTILTDEQSIKLLNLIGFLLDTKLSLLYQASRDSFSSSSFHSKCDGINNTLTIIKSKYNNFIFGGFTNAQWNGQVNSFAYDSNAFLFSFVNAYNISARMNVNPFYAQFAIYSSSSSGPSFGGIYLPDSSNINECSSNIFPYNLPSFVPFKNSSSLLAGSSSFLTQEIEVYTFNNGKYKYI